MAEVSRRAARERRENVLFVRASLADLPPELHQTASRLTVLLPWGSLLRAAAGGDAEGLSAMRALCRTGAALDVVIALDPNRDGASWRKLGLDPGAPFGADLPAIYEQAGFKLLAVEPFAPEALRELGTTWAKRLAASPGRRAWQLHARAERA